MEKKKIWVLGSCNFDTTLQVDRLPSKGETLSVKAILTALGGKGANVAVACARSGADVGFIGCVGRDEGGRRTIDAFKRWGVDASHLSVAEKYGTGQAFIIVDADGDNVIMVEPGANHHISPPDLSGRIDAPDSKLRAATPAIEHHTAAPDSERLIDAPDDGFHAPADAAAAHNTESPVVPPDFKAGDLLISQYEVDLDTLLLYMRYAKERSVITLLNPSPFVMHEPTLQLADYLFLNETEAAALAAFELDSAENTRKAAVIIAKRYDATVVVTLGERGAILVRGNAGWRTDGFPVNVRDTQGAGDTFMGVFAASLAAGPPASQTPSGAAASMIYRALLRANIAAALSVTSMGSAQQSFPDLAEADRICGEMLRRDTIMEFSQ